MEDYQVHVVAANPLALLHMLEVCDARVRLAPDLEQAMEPFMVGCQATHVLCSLNMSDNLDMWEFEVE